MKYDDAEENVDAAKLQPHARIILKLLETDNNDYVGPLNDDIFAALKALWNDSGVQKTYCRRNEFQLPDCAK